MTIESARELIPTAGKHEEMHKLLELGLDKDNLVVLIGSFKGLTAGIIHEAYGSRMMCYDPQEDMCEQLRARGLDSVEVFAFGLGKKSGTFPMWEVGNDACSFYRGNRGAGEGRMYDVSEALRDLKIDLLFLNCEGGEFDILDRLHETDQIKNIRMLMVQFHEKGNGNYEQSLEKLKEDFAVVWTIGISWTLLERMTDTSSLYHGEEMMDEKPPCSECGFSPEPEKDYKISMGMHKQKVHKQNHT